MLKHKPKPPTPQEIYKAKKQREEEEKEAFLPPGLFNHGNTCFMNSTLQGLIATQPLHDLVVSGNVGPHMHDVDGSSIVSRRSPLLTNGHGVGGQYEQQWSEGMPLGDRWLDIMQRAWGVQGARKRENMSPRDVLATIGRKYDQYLDFQQQDAHEFLRHLLDAMRMEEYDIIKKRQPPPPKGKRRKHDSRTPDDLLTMDGPMGASTSQPSGEKLESFVDMLFGGRLASILVCEKCKKISTTYEDFNDLSLSMKPEDYVKERKRDKFRLFAKKLRFLPKELGPGLPPAPRASSMPASPARRSIDLPHEDPPLNEGPRRGSFEHSRPEAGSSEDEVKNGIISISHADLQKALAPGFDEDADGDDEKEKGVSPGVEVIKDGSGVKQGGEVKESVHFDAAQVEAHKEARKEEREHKEKDKDKDDPWGKFGRRISVTMKKGTKNASKRLSKSMDRHRHRDEKDDETVTSRPASQKGTLDSGSELGEVSDAARSRAVSPTRSPLISPPLNVPVANPHTETRPAVEKRPKSPRPPKPSREETEYLRKILADTHPSSTSPFALLHQALSSAGSGSATAQNLLTKLGNLPGIEECLRLFTAVEILDGENMVGCRRCWKISNGTYKPKARPCTLQEDEDEDESGDQDGEPINPVAVAPIMDSPVATPNLSRASTTMTLATLSNIFEFPTLTISSTPPTSISVESDDNKPQTEEPTQLLIQPLETFGGLPIPSISTTAPESPLIPQPPIAQVNPASLSSDNLVSNVPATNSLSPPTISRSRRNSNKKADRNSDSSDDGSDSSASDASVYSDVSSAASSAASPPQSPRLSSQKLSPEQRPELSRSQSDSAVISNKVPRSQQVILRRMYKRYLIATPPPILVVHLKRFQQMTRMPIMSFTSGFKKVDEFVAFPEYLDLSPYLAPKKEDFGLGRSSNDKPAKKSSKSKEVKCMYRLYAVVVHIGSMLGGHYVAYTALPSSSSSKPQPQPSSQPSPTSTSLPEQTRVEEPHTEHGKDTTTNTNTTKDTKAQAPRQWAYISDTVVRLTTLEEVLKVKAYICMYERV